MKLELERAQTRANQLTHELRDARRELDDQQQQQHQPDTIHDQSNLTTSNPLVRKLEEEVSTLKQRLMDLQTYNNNNNSNNTTNDSNNHNN